MASRVRHSLVTTLVTASVAVQGLSTTGPASVPAPVPAAASVATMRTASPADLGQRYAASRTEIRAAERMAAGHDYPARAAKLRALAGPEHQFLSFDGRDGGLAVEVIGDLARARRIAVLVPGADTNLDTYQRFRSGALALHRELGTGSAVIAWLGYRTPSTVSTELLTTRAADRAVPALRQFVDSLAAARPDSPVSLLCHSYGSVVCGRAVAGLPVANLVLFGSPGAGYDSVAELRTHAAVWAGRGATDWIERVPHAKLDLPFGTIGLGADPMSPAFGARTLRAGDGGHSAYLLPGSVALRSIAAIVAAT